MKTHMTKFCILLFLSDEKQQRTATNWGYYTQIRTLKVILEVCKKSEKKFGTFPSFSNHLNNS